MKSESDNGTRVPPSAWAQRVLRAFGPIHRAATSLCGGGPATDTTPYFEEAHRILAMDLRYLTDIDIVAEAGRVRRAWPRIPTFDAASAEVDRGAVLLWTRFMALVREASRRAIGLEPFTEQIVSGLAMAHGGIVQVATGEGKTLAAVFPAALHALAGCGVHVLTFNDYLARRDAAWMGPVYRLLGLSVGCVQEDMPAHERRAAYACDVTYATAREAGFDLLRDGLCLETGDQVHRPFYMALIDEADSIMIDEARIPLVIAGNADSDDTGLADLADLARRLRPDVDFLTDDEDRNLFLTDDGIVRVESATGCTDLFSGTGVRLQAAVRNALHAQHLLRRDVDYIVRDGAVELVDELTGRVADDRHWPDGLQAAVEAKEGLTIGTGGTILGSITLQHLLRLYPRLCGMTATAAPAAHELAEVYGLSVVDIPPHRPCRRIDHPDAVFVECGSRDAAVCDEVERVHRTGQPILVGTASVEASDRLAAHLRDRGVTCSVLNARNDEDEAAVVAEAGGLGRVTISTNMAGRGTDIRLGGPLERERDAVLDLGGLFVIGTTRHDSLRIDLQLRGRAGRQGDPGASRFFVSLDDDLLRRARVVANVPRMLASASRGSDLQAPAIRHAIDHAQRVAEGVSFDMRKRVYEYGEVVERQRRLVVARRRNLLEAREIPTLLPTRCPERWNALIRLVGEDALRAVERRLALLAIDRCWAEHLDELRLLRDEIHLVALGARTPVVEFTRTAIAAFDTLSMRIGDAVVSSFESLEITAHGVDWEMHGLRGPSATWTYLISDDAFAPNVLRTLASHASLGLWATLLWAPLLFVWGLYLHWRRRREIGRPAPPP